jgi:hypothetical protein
LPRIDNALAAGVGGGGAGAGAASAFPRVLLSLSAPPAPYLLADYKLESWKLLLDWYDFNLGGHISSWDGSTNSEHKKAATRVVKTMIMLATPAELSTLTSGAPSKASPTWQVWDEGRRACCLLLQEDMMTALLAAEEAKRIAEGGAIKMRKVKEVNYGAVSTRIKNCKAITRQ